jgi:hypothetical protein
MNIHNEKDDPETKANPPLIFDCPHCQQHIIVEIEQVNCAIFRHGVLKTTGQQMDPHAPKAQCDLLAAEGAIWGCGKPFRLVLQEDGKFSLHICEYL